jgi:L-2-hydroxyglutarate oxidase LhgO
MSNPSDASTSSPRSFGVIGGGILGLAVARRLQEVLPGVDVTVLEKETRVAAHQTGHNSGVVHAGLYYPPGSLKATLCRRGVALLKEYCAQRSLPYEECGKLVVAVDETEVPALNRIEERARDNAVPGLARLDGNGLRDIEPHAAGVAALHSPRTAITDFVAVAEAFADDVAAAGGVVRLGTAVTGIDQPLGGGVRVRTAAGEDLRFDRLVICAGLQSDVVARWAGDADSPAIIPFRGEYYTLVPARTRLVRALIYPVPDPAYPFLGVHFTRRVDGRVDVGPNAVLALAREGYRRRDVSLGELREILSWPGLRQLARAHWRMGLAEFAGSASRSLFLDRARRYVPELEVRDVEAAPAGVRAQAVDADGSLVDDFRISFLGPVTALRNAPSPAATSSLAIAEHVVERIVSQASAAAGKATHITYCGGQEPLTPAE